MTTIASARTTSAAVLVTAIGAVLETLRAQLPPNHSAGGGVVPLLITYAEECRRLAYRMAETTDDVELSQLVEQYRLYADMFHTVQTQTREDQNA